MKNWGIIILLILLLLLFPIRALAHHCGHHNQHSGGWNCEAWRGPGLDTLGGTVAEVIYRPGISPDAALVEARLQSGSKSILVRIAPAGFLKQKDLSLKEGDTIAIRGYRVSAPEEEFFVATEVTKGNRTVSLRDAWGRPLW